MGKRVMSTSMAAIKTPISVINRTDQKDDSMELVKLISKIILPIHHFPDFVPKSTLNPEMLIPLYQIWYFPYAIKQASKSGVYCYHFS